MLQCSIKSFFQIYCGIFLLGFVDVTPPNVPVGCRSSRSEEPQHQKKVGPKHSGNRRVAFVTAENREITLLF
jgi:hypothetical protein